MLFCLKLRKMSPFALLLFCSLPFSLVVKAESQTCESELDIPIVDFSALNKFEYSLEDLNNLQSSIHDACTEFGIFELTGHGISEHVIHDAFEAHEALFTLSKDVKESIPISSNGFTRGYVALGSESGSNHLLECKEAFSYGLEWKPNPIDANMLQGENIWPNDINFKSKYLKSLLIWYNESVRVSELIALGIAPTLGLDQQSIEQSIQGGETISLMRLFRYIPSEHSDCINGGKELEMERIGSSPHTDWGFLTFILGDGQKGLQVQHKGEWFELQESSRKNPIAICGDYLSLMSHSQTKSPVHRVQLPSSNHRNSFVFFYYPNFNANFGQIANKIVKTQLHLKEEDEGNLKIQNEEEIPNTMLDLARKDPTALDIPFGEYIMRKWSGVFKK